MVQPLGSGCTGGLMVVGSLTDAEFAAASAALQEARLKKEEILRREPAIQELLVKAYEAEVEARNEHGSEAEAKERAFKKRITKAGYADRMDGLIAIESLLGLVSFMNVDKLNIEWRRQMREKNPHMRQRGVTGIFETNMYLMDLVNRQHEATRRSSPSAAKRNMVLRRNLTRSSMCFEQDSFKRKKDGPSNSAANGGAEPKSPGGTVAEEPVKRRGFNKVCEPLPRLALTTGTQRTLVRCARYRRSPLVRAGSHRPIETVGTGGRARPTRGPAAPHPKPPSAPPPRRRRRRAGVRRARDRHVLL